MTPAGLPSMRAQLERGVGGFEGAVSPIIEPVKISLGPVHRYRARTLNFMTGNGGNTKVLSAEFVGSRVLERDKIKVSIEMRRGCWNGRAICCNSPLFKIEQWAEHNGTPIGDVAVSFPAVEDGSIAAGEAELETLREDVRQQTALSRIFAVSYGTYSCGSEVMAPGASARWLRTMFPKMQFQQNTLKATVAGTAIWRERPVLVVHFTGTAKAHGSKG